MLNALHAQCKRNLDGNLAFSHTSLQLTDFQEYVASLIGLYKNNGAVSCVGNYFPFIQPAHPGVSQGVPGTLVPNCMESCYGQISIIETATYSLGTQSPLICTLQIDGFEPTMDCHGI